MNPKTSLTATTRQVGGVAIVELNGKITLGDTTQVLRDAMLALLSEGQKNIVVNMKGVTYVDSAGLGELVRSFTTATKQGGAIKLLHLQGKMKDLLRMTNLTAIFPVFEDERTALASFGIEPQA